MGQKALLHADEEDGGVFEALGLVQGDEGDGVGAGVDVVGVGYEGDAIEEGGEGFVGFHA